MGGPRGAITKDSMSPTDDSKPAGERPGEKARKRRRGRRPATIDLAATEVAVEAAEADEPEAGAPETGDKAAQEATAETDEAAGTEAPEAKSAEQARPVWTRNMSLALMVFAAGAVLGGLIALGAYGGLVRLGLLPGAGRDVAPIEARIDALRADIDGEIAALRSSRLPSGALDELSAEARQSAERLKAVEGTLARLPRDDPGQRLSALDGKLAALAARLGEVEAAAGAGREEVRGLIEKMAASGDGQAASAAISALTRRILAVEEAARTETQRQIASARGEIEARMAEISKEMADLRNAIAKNAGGTPAAALAVAVAGLERAVNSGVAFDRELSTVEALAGPRDEIAALKPYAVSGVARRDALGEDFQDAASAAISTTIPQTDGFLDRLIADARRIVRIRPTGEVEGDTTGAILARAETRLAAGNLAAAVEQLASLDPAAQAAMSGWLERARARLQAERLLAALNEQVLTGLSAGERTGAQ